MNMMPRNVPVPATIGTGERRNKMLEKIAVALNKHDMRNLGGFDRLEDRIGKAVAEISIGTNSVFSLIAEKLQMEAGIATDGTVGGVMEALGYDRYSDEAAKQAHEIGCHCHGNFISPGIAAQRIRNLKSV